MTILFIIVFTILVIALVFVIVVLSRQTKKEESERTVQLVKDIYDKKEFVPKKIFYVSKDTVFAINKKETKLAIISNLDINNLSTLKYYVINANNITQIDKTPFGINVEYISQGNRKLFSITSKDKEIENLIHDVFKKAGVRKLEEKYSITSFQYTAGCDWECSYIWAYMPYRTTFAYYKTRDKKAIYKLNLLKEFFTIDVKFEYFVAPVLGIAQQLSIFEPNFLNEIFLSLLSIVKQKCNTVAENRIYFDSYNDIVYLTNATTTLQSVILKEVEEVIYNDDRLTFTFPKEEKTINFLADKYLLEEFENFITSYNLRKIAQSFDYTTDKLINTTEGTKFIVDYTRDRVVYCAGLNSLSKFTYMTILFSNLENAELEKGKDGCFVRIYTKDRNIIDVTCKKTSVAQYILAQILTIINM